MSSHALSSVCLCQLVKLNVTTKVNPAGELRETYLGAAVAVGLISAVTGYRYNKKVGRHPAFACVCGQSI